MNLMAKNGVNVEEKEDRVQPHTVASLLSSSSSSYHNHHHHQHHQQQPFFPPSPGGWQADCGGPSDQKEEAAGWLMVEREHMFDKVVTPSDVGKLNRLVIPKQHAERYFPLDSSTNYKGLLLNFEDRNGKLWRFQYSYWNSSQSYVMTKGWSRFVKEKKLDAGDVVSFQRGVGVTAKDRLFIDWRRRSSQPLHLSSPSDLSSVFHNHNIIHPWVLQSLPASRNLDFMLRDSSINPNYNSRSVCFGPGGFGAPQQQFKMTQRCDLRLGFDLFDPLPPAASAPVVHGKSSGKQLRLFGVNLLSEHEDDQDVQDTTDDAGWNTVNSLIPSSSSSIPYLQLTPYNYERETEYYDQSKVLSASSSTLDFNKITKSSISNISLDLKMSQTETEI
ncbi:hypothetical protein R6Q59_022067 [Mikania micrantha]|uniref:TF-B3 domain-containing protein n=1 Tax=Mikania micrantha TaxID=192012 RepID=A0A5N6MVM6_9ASTR|nr:hypothetical protein E3N88_27060 [Mikania micrantha]